MENSCPQAANQSYSECVLEYILTNLTQRNQGGTALCRKKPPSPGNIDCAQVERVSFSLIPPVALQLANNFLEKWCFFKKTCSYSFIPSICSFIYSFTCYVASLNTLLPLSPLQCFSATAVSWWNSLQLAALCLYQQLWDCFSLSSANYKIVLAFQQRLACWDICKTSEEQGGVITVWDAASLHISNLPATWKNYCFIVLHTVRHRNYPIALPEGLLATLGIKLPELEMVIVFTDGQASWLGLNYC